jgi:hypothetical protein
MGLETPRDGGRVVLTRAAVGQAEVTYAVDLHGPGATWAGTATIRLEDGQIDVGTLTGEGEPPGWLLDAARAFLRTVWAGRQKEDPPVWPRRLRRWRAPKKG